MITETIAPKYVNPAKDGKKYGTVKMDDGTSYAVPSTLFHAFSPNEPTEIKWASQKWGDKDVRVVAEAKAGKYAEAPATAPRVNGNGHAKDERMIFITGVVGRAMGSGKFGASDITNLTLDAADAWDALQSR